MTAAIKKEKILQCVSANIVVPNILSDTLLSGRSRRSKMTCVVRVKLYCLCPCDRNLLFSAMLARVKDVQKDVDKLASGNETLQMYIDNLTLQMAKRR